MVIERLVPAALRDPAQRRPLLGWLGVGMVVRLLLMPSAVSADLLAVYWRSHLIAYDGTVYADYLVNMGAHYVHAGSLRLLQWALPPPDAVWTDPWWWSDASALAPQIQRAFSDAPHALQTLFVLKVPYLLAEVGAGLVLLALVGSRTRPDAVRRAWAFWMLSPIGLYATYAFGRYEAFAVVCVVGALWACERDRPWLGAVLLGVGITMRSYPLLLVPVFALVAVRGAWKQVAWAAVALLPFALVMASNQLVARSLGELARLRDFSTGSTFLAYTLPVDGTGTVYLFLVAALLVYGVLLGRARGWWGGAPVAVEQLWVWLLVLHAAMFSLATFSAHYLMWWTPFVALALARRPAWRGTLPLHLLQAAAVLALADLLGGPGTLLGLFEPLAPDLATAGPSLREALLTSPDLALQAAGALRTANLVLVVLLAAPAVVELARGVPATGITGAGAAPEPARLRVPPAAEAEAGSTAGAAPPADGEDGARHEQHHPRGGEGGRVEEPASG